MEPVNQPRETSHPYATIQGHRSPTFGVLGDSSVLYWIEGEGQDSLYEELVTRHLAGNRVQLMCIPFFVYGLSILDVIQLNEDSVVEGVVERSGYSCVRIALSDHACETTIRSISEFVMQRRILAEWSSWMLLVLAIPDSSTEAKLIEMLADLQYRGELTWEWGSERASEVGVVGSVLDAPEMERLTQAALDRFATLRDSLWLSKFDSNGFRITRSPKLSRVARDCQSADLLCGFSPVERFLNTIGWIEQVLMVDEEMLWEPYFALSRAKVVTSRREEVDYWVITGDLPPAVFECTNFPVPMLAIRNYVSNLEAWAQAAMAGEIPDHSMPVYCEDFTTQMPMDDEFLAYVLARIRFIRLHVMTSFDSEGKWLLPRAYRSPLRGGCEENGSPAEHKGVYLNLHYQHRNPTCATNFDSLIQVRLTTESNTRVGEKFEQLECLKNGDYHHQIACIPLYVRDLACGDIVEKLDYGVVKVVERSGRYVIRIYIADNTVSELVETRLTQLGGRLEIQSSGLWAVDCPNLGTADQIAGFLETLRLDGAVGYERGDIGDKPCPYVLGRRDQDAAAFADGIELRKIEIGDQYQFDCGSARLGNEGLFAYALVLRSNPRDCPFIATFADLVTEEQLAGANFLNASLFLADCDSAPMVHGRWRWLNRLPLPPNYPLPDLFWVSEEAHLSRPLFSIEEGAAGVRRPSCMPDEVRGLRERHGYSSAPQVAFETLCAINGLQPHPTVDEYATSALDLLELRSLVRFRALQALRRIYGLEA